MVQAGTMLHTWTHQWKTRAPEWGSRREQVPEWGLGHERGLSVPGDPRPSWSEVGSASLGSRASSGRCRGRRVSGPPEP